MRSSQLHQILKSRSDIISIHKNDHYINSMFFMDQNTSDLSPNSIYFMQPEQINTCYALPDDMLVVCADDKQRAELSEKLNFCGCNVIFILKENYIQILNSVQLLLSGSQRDNSSYAYFLQMMLNDHDLSYILAEAEKQCGNPLVAIDMSGKILASSSKELGMDTLWQSYVNNGYCPVEFMQHCYDTLLTRNEISSQPYVYRCQETGIYYMSSPMMIKGSFHGYMFMLSKTESLDPRAYNILPVISRIASDHIKRKNPELGSSSQMYRTLLRDILSGESTEAVASRLASGGFKFPKLMRIMIVRSYYYHSERDFFKTLSAQLSAVFGAMPLLQYDNSIVIVQDMCQPKEQLEKSLNFLRHLADQNNLSVGISNEINSIFDLARCYCQADEAIRMSGYMHKENDLVFFKDMAFDVLAGKMMNVARLREFCHPALDILRKYDAANDTQLFETARVYVSSGCNQKLTAELLFAHRNTISYRKQQICDITGLDLQDPEELFQLNYSFRLYSHINA